MIDEATKQLLIGLGQALLIILSGVALTIRTNAKINAAKRENDEKRREEAQATADKYEADALKTAEAFRSLLQKENERSDRFEHAYHDEIKKNDKLWEKISEFRNQLGDAHKRIAVLEAHDANAKSEIESLTRQVATLERKVAEVEQARDKALELVETKNNELREKDVLLEHQRGEIKTLTFNVARLEDELQDALKRITSLETKKGTDELDPNILTDNAPA